MDKVSEPASVKLTRQIPYIFFVALTLFYLSLSPGSMLGMGYISESVNASNQMISNLGDWLSLQLAGTPLDWPRHGLYESILQIPFLLLSRLVFGTSPPWQDHILSLEPVLMTSALCTLIFVWVRRMTSSLAWSYILAMAAALSTMLWPYAYIGLETSQSLFLMLSAYLAFRPHQKTTWLGGLAFALSCGLTISLKSNGIFLVPAVASLVFFYFHADLANERLRSLKAWGKPLMVLSVIAVLYLVNAYARSLSPAWEFGAFESLKLNIAGGPLTIVFNAISLITSPNKGLIIYAPIVFLCLAALPRAWRNDQRLVIFAGLALAGLLGGCSLVVFWADETWGPRYLHSAIGPLIIALACAKQSMKFQLRRELALIALILCGLGVSFLGAFFYYGSLHHASINSSRSTLEALQHDPRFNHIRFNLSLMKVWVKGDRSSEQAKDLWPPEPYWWFLRPADAPAPKTINLKDFALPQSHWVRFWRAPLATPDQIVSYVQFASLWLGMFLLAGIGYLVRKGRQYPLLADPEPDAELVSTPDEVT